MTSSSSLRDQLVYYRDVMVRVSRIIVSSSVFLYYWNRNYSKSSHLRTNCYKFNVTLDKILSDGKNVNCYCYLQQNLCISKIFFLLTSFGALKNFRFEKAGRVKKQNFKQSKKNWLNVGNEVDLVLKRLTYLTRKNSGWVYISFDISICYCIYFTVKEAEPKLFVLL